MSTPVSPATPSGTKFTLERRLALRTLNLAAKSDADSLAHLDSSLRRNTAFVRRLKNVTAETGDAIIHEFGLLKLDRYVTEAADMLAENRLRTANDICAVIEVISAFHQRYADFRPALLQALEREVMAAPEGSSGEDRPAWLTRQRQLLRLLAELHLAGVIEDPMPVHRALIKLLPEDDTNGPLNVPAATSFMKGVGPYYTGLRVSAEAMESFLSPEWRDKFHETICAYFRAMCRLLVRTSSRLRALESKGRHHYETRGDLSSTQAGQLQEALTSFERQRTNLQGLAEQLDLALPDLGADVEAPRVVEGKVVFADLSFKRAESEGGTIFESEEERSLYEDIADLAERVPEVLLAGKGSGGGGSASVPDTPTAADAPAPPSAALEDLSGVADVDPESVGVRVAADEQLAPEDRKSAVAIEAFFEKLPRMQSRALADQAAIDFCFINSKGMRRRLAGALIELPCRRLDLLPFIGRLLATLKPHFPDVAAEVCSSLVGQFVFLFHKASYPILGTRGRVCRFIGELAKFGVMPQTTVYAMLKKAVLEDLSGYNIDMVALLLESCGRYLFNQPESHRRLLNLFEVIHKKMTKGLGMEPSQMVQLEGAIRAANPPADRSVSEKRSKAPRLQYLFKLVRTDLTGESAEHVFGQIRKFPWADEECQRELLRALGKAWKVRYGAIPLLASMLASLRATYPAFVADLVDYVLEEIRWGLETKQARLNQRLMALTRYVGELFCRGVVGADVVFGALQQLVTLGHPGVPRVTHVSEIDPPGNHFRIRLVCVLLQTCNKHLSADGAAQRSLDAFIVWFEYYLATKTRLPMDVEYQLDDTFDAMGRERHPTSLPDAIERMIAASSQSLLFLRADLDAKVGGAAKKPEEDEEGEAGTVLVAPPRDEQFDKALTGMVAQSLEERKLERRVGVFDAPIPLGMTSPAGGLKMLTRRRNKAAVRDLNVDPAAVPFIGAALVGKEREAMEAREVGKLALESQRPSSPSAVAGGTGRRRDVRNVRV